MKRCIAGCLSVLGIFIGLVSSAVSAETTVGVSFHAPSINEGDSAVLTLQLSKTAISDYTFYLKMSATQQGDRFVQEISPSTYFPGVEPLYPVTIRSRTSSTTIPLQSLGYIGSQTERKLSAAILPELIPLGFEVDSQADSATIMLGDGITRISLESTSSYVNEGEPAMIRAALSGDVPFNRNPAGAPFKVTAELTGDGWLQPVGSKVELIIPDSGIVSPWLPIPTQTADRFQERVAGLKVVSYTGAVDPTVDTENAKTALLIRQKMTDLPICTFEKNVFTVTEPRSGDTVIEVSIRSTNGTPLAGTRIPFKVSGNAVEGEQYGLPGDAFFLFDGLSAKASIKVTVRNDGLATPDRKFSLDLYTPNSEISFGTHRAATLTIINTDPVTGVADFTGGFIGNAAQTTLESVPLPVLAVAKGVPQGSAASITFTVSGAKNGVDYTIIGASNINKNKWVISTDANGLAAFTYLPLNNYVANEKNRKVTLKIVSVKTPALRKKFKRINPKIALTVLDNDPLVNPVHITMPHFGGKRFASYTLTDAAAAAANNLEDTSLLYIDPALTDTRTAMGASVVILSDKRILYNTNTDEFRKNITQQQFDLGLTDVFNAVVSKSGAGATQVPVSVCIGNLYTHNATLKIPFSVFKAATDSVVVTEAFSKKPSVRGLYYDPFQKLKGAKPQKAKQTTLTVSPILPEYNTEVFARFTRKLSLIDRKALRETQKRGEYFAGVASKVQKDPVGVEIKLKTSEMTVVGKKSKLDVTVAGMIMAPPHIDSVAFFTEPKSKTTVMKVTARLVSDKTQFSLEYRDNKGTIRHHKLKPLKAATQKPVVLVGLNGEPNEFISNPPAVYPNAAGVFYFTLPADRKLPSAYNNRFDLYAQSDIGASAVASIGFPWMPYIYTRNDIRFVPKTIAGIPALECFRDDGYQAKPLIILNHGIGQSKDHELVKKSAESLANNGFFVVLTDAVGHGERLNPAGLLGTEIPVVWADELFQVVQTYQNDPRVNYSRLGMTGFSMGGCAAYAFMARHPNILTAAAPMIATPDLLTVSPLITDSVYYSINDVRPSTVEQRIRARQFASLNNPISTWPKMTSVNLSMINGAIDPLIPGSGCSVLHTNLRPSAEQTGTGLALLFINHAGHEITIDMTDLRDQWFVRYLK